MAGVQRFAQSLEDSGYQVTQNLNNTHLRRNKDAEDDKPQEQRTQEQFQNTEEPNHNAGSRDRTTTSIGSSKSELTINVTVNGSGEDIRLC